MSYSKSLAVALAIVVAGFAIQYLVWDSVGAVPPWLILYPAVFAAAVLTGQAGGLAATFAATLLGWYFFVPPGHGFTLAEFRQGLSVVIFATTGIAFSVFSQRLREASERKAVAQNDEKLRAVIDHGADAIFVATHEARLIYANQQACKLLGYPPEELIGLSVADITPAEAVEAELARFREMTTVGHLNAEVLMKRKDGRPVAVEMNAIRLPDGTFYGAARDITERTQMRQALLDSRERLQLLIDHAPAGLAMFDSDMHYLAVSRRWRDDFKLGDRELIGQSHYEIFPEIGEDLKAIHRRALAGEVLADSAARFVRADGNVQWLRWEVRPWRHGDGSIGGMVIFSEDVTRQREAEIQLRVTARVFDQAGEAIMIAGPDLIIQTVNAAFCRISGYSASEAIGQATTLLKSGRHSPEFYQQMWHAIATNGFWQGEIWNRRKSGEIFPEWLTITRVDDDSGQVAHYVAVFSDITLIKDSQRKVEFLATHDILTSLPNRALFHDRLSHALVAMRRSKSRLALLFIDLDNFKTINDTLGHDVGDALLQQVATRLREAVRDVDTLARLGGDEFTAIISDCTTESASTVASRIASYLASSFAVQDHALMVSASIGIAFYPEDGDDVSKLIKSADAAMYRAKEQGRNRIEFFVPDLHVRLLKRTMVESALRQALRHDRLRLVFQPKVALADGHPLVGAEALLRWRDPELGDVSPGEFIPVAEASGLIVEVGHVVQRLLIEQMTQWLRQGMAVPTIAFNVSPRSIREASFAEELLALMRADEVPSDRIQVEITEGALLESSEVVVANLEMLAKAGIRVAVDDFGTGYSSLSYLKRLPLTELKIDKSFVDGLGKDREDEAIARAVLALANALELETVAEGVETAEQLAWLTQAGCDVAQGYHFYQPLEADAFSEVIGGHTQSLH